MPFAFQEVAAATVGFLAWLLPVSGVVVGVLSVLALVATPWLVARLARSAASVGSGGPLGLRLRAARSLLVIVDDRKRKEFYETHFFPLIREYGWIITNADGEEEEVRGDGVVGEQPVLEPGAVYNYNSFCHLKTSVGTMHGEYTMVARSGATFEARIAPFTLAVPNALN